MELLTINYYTKAPGNERRQIDDKARTRTKRMRNSDIDYFTDIIKCFPRFVIFSQFISNNNNNNNNNNKQTCIAP